MTFGGLGGPGKTLEGLGKLGLGGPWKALEGLGRPWRALKALEGLEGLGGPWKAFDVFGRPWKALEGLGRPWKERKGSLAAVHLQIILPSIYFIRVEAQALHAPCCTSNIRIVRISVHPCVTSFFAGGASCAATSHMYKSLIWLASV